MAQKIINTGSVANDHTGDPLKVGGDKINDNFTELYASLVALQAAIDALPAPSTGTAAAPKYAKITEANAPLSISSDGLTVTRASSSGASLGQARVGRGVIRGKYYFEARFTGPSGFSLGMGFMPYWRPLGDNWIGAALFDSDISLALYENGKAYKGSGEIGTWGPTLAENDWVAYAVDFDAGRIYAKNITQGSSWNTVGADPVAGTGGIAWSPAAVYKLTCEIAHGGDGVVFNFGASNYLASKPTGYSDWPSSEVTPAADGSVLLTDDFGAVGDGTTENAVALVAFNDWARVESQAGRAVYLRVPPGSYHYDYSLCQGWLYNIKKLVMEGYGAAFLNTYDRTVRGADSGKQWAFPQTCRPELRGGNGFLINTTTLGGSTVTLKTVGQASNFAVGDWVMVSSLDVQHFGYPPNCNYFEFVQITAINSGTGVITVTPALQQPHRDDYPDDGADEPCGKARLWKLDWGFGPWDIDHEFRGITVDLLPGNDLAYIDISGQSVTFVDCKLPGVSPSVAGTVKVIGGELRALSEPDKLVDLFYLDGVTHQDKVTAQSASINRMVLRNGRGQVWPGVAKSILVDNYDISLYAQGPGGATYGVNQNVVIRSSIVRQSNLGTGHSFGPYATVTPGDVDFIDGVVRFRRAAGLHYYWNPPPGTLINLESTAGGDSGDLGTGVVVSVTEDATYIYYKTTLPFASIPSWASGQIGMCSYGELLVQNSTGTDEIRMASEATRLGWPTGDYYKDVFIGKTAQGGNWSARPGVLRKLVANVVTPGAGGILKLSGYPQNTATMLNATTGPDGLAMFIHGGTAGRREYTGAGLVTLHSSDAVQLDGVNQTAIPQNLWWGSQIYWFWTSLDVTAYDDHQMPLIEVEWYFDRGAMSRRPTTATGRTDLVLS